MNIIKFPDYIYFIFFMIINRKYVCFVREKENSRKKEYHAEVILLKNYFFEDLLAFFLASAFSSHATHTVVDTKSDE